MAVDAPVDLDRSDLGALAQRVRQHVVRMVYGAKSGHIGGSLSATDIMAVLYARILRHDPGNPTWDDRDRFIMSKGHCTPVQYATLAEFGYLDTAELETFRRKGTRLQGHSVIGKPLGVENSAGSLGMGLSFGLGIRLGLRLAGNNESRVFVLMGDGEQQEGQVWEAAMAASHHSVDRLVALIDRNRIQNDTFVEATMEVDPLAERYRAFGWEVLDGVDGHDLNDIERGLHWATSVSGKPAAVIFTTTKGKGVSFMENNPGFHGAAPSDEQFEAAMIELGAP